MKKICKLSALLFVMLLGVSQTVGASGFYYGKATAKVSSKCSGRGMVYVGPSVTFQGDKIQNAAGEEVLNGDSPFSYDSETGMIDVSGINLNDPVQMAELEKWFSSEESSIVATKVDLTSMGMARPLYAAYMAYPAPGYYLKGWSTIDNDASLGNANPFQYSTMTQSMASGSEVKEIFALIGGNWVSMNMYAATGTSNRFLRVEKSWSDTYLDDVTHECEPWGYAQEIYQAFKDESGDYELYELNGANIYVPYRDNANRRFYIIDNNGKKIEKFGGSYLSFPVDDKGNEIPDATYIIAGGAGKYFVYGCDLSNPMQYDPDADPLVVKFQSVMTTATEGPAAGKQMVMPAVYMKNDRDCSWGSSDFEQVSFLPSESSLPQVPTIYASFAPVQVNGCNGGNRAKMYTTGTQVEMYVKFATSFADEVEDFDIPTFTKTTIDGVGTFAIGDAGISYSNNEVTVPVIFTSVG